MRCRTTRWRSLARHRCLVGDGLLRPPAAKRLVQLRPAGQPRKLDRDQLLLGLVLLALRVEDREVVIHAVLEAHFGQSPGLGNFLLQRLLRGGLPIIGAARGQPVGHLAERALDGALVLGNVDFLAHLRRVEVCLVGAGIEDRQRDLWREGPGGAAGEQPRQRGAGQADAGRQRNTREERRTRRADIGVGGFEPMLGRHDVRPLFKQGRRQPRRQLGNERVAIERLRGRQIGRQWATDQQ